MEIAFLAGRLTEYVAATGVLSLFYFLLLRGRLPYRECRIFLLSLPILAALLSQFTIVYRPEARIVETKALANASAFAPVAPQQAEPAAFAGVAEGTAESIVPAAAEAVPEEKWYESVSLGRVLAALYGSVAILLLIAPAVGVARILRLRYTSEVIRCDGYDIVVSEKIPTPFSFHKTIFIGNNIQGDKLDIAISHEKWHILHRHYIDVYVAELLARLMWFNPFAWMLRTEIKKIDEFEVDRSVLDEGRSLHSYQTAILDELLDKSPYMASGLGSSFTRRRFVMMSHRQGQEPHALRRIALLVSCVAVFVLFTIQRGEAEVIYVEKPLMEAGIAGGSEIIPDAAAEIIDVAGLSQHVIVPEEVESAPVPEPSADTYKYDGNGPFIPSKYMHSKTLILTGPELGDEQKMNSGYHIPLEDLVFVAPDPAVTRGVNSIEVTDSETIVTYVSYLSWEAQWIIWGNNTYLEDAATGNRYVIRDVDGGKCPMNRLVMVIGAKGMYIAQTLRFPRLADGVEKVHFVEPEIPGQDRYIPRKNRAPDPIYRNLIIRDLPAMAMRRVEIIR